ncbi:unnamed protein product [Zymoseptoria tritici ST99CH_3D1]|nr:unnamed protein product [Zymoseptoria tritici ST99CH_3D1]
MASLEEQSSETVHSTSTAIANEETATTTVTRNEDTDTVPSPALNALRFRVAHEKYPELEFAAFCLMNGHDTLLFTRETLPKFLACLVPEIYTTAIFFNTYSVDSPTDLPLGMLISGQQVFKYLATNGKAGNEDHKAVCGEDSTFHGEHSNTCPHRKAWFAIEAAYFRTSYGCFEWHCLSDAFRSKFETDYKSSTGLDFITPVASSTTPTDATLILDENGAGRENQPVGEKDILAVGGKDILASYHDLLEKLIPILTQLIVQSLAYGLDAMQLSELAHLCKLLITNRPVTYGRHHTVYDTYTLRLGTHAQPSF